MHLKIKKEMIKIELFNIEIDRKKYIKILIIGIVIIVCYILFTFFYFAVPKVYKMGENTKIEETNIVKTGMNSVYRGTCRMKLYRLGL